MSKSYRLVQLCFLLALLPGCTNFHRSVVADSTTTYVGLKQPNTRELNPIFKDSSPEMTAVGGAALVIATQWVAKKILPKKDCVSFTSFITSGKYGAAANNLGVISGAGDASKVIGLGVGVYSYNKIPRDEGLCDE